MASAGQGGSGSQWDEYAERIRQQLPVAPEGLLDAYMKWIPLVAIIFGAIGLVFLLFFGLLGAILSPLLVLGGAEGLSFGASAFVSLAIGIVSSALEIVGGLMMMKRRLTGWWIFALALVLSAVSSLFSINILWLAITVLIAYVHLQVKPRYV